MTSLTLALASALTICVCIALIGGLILVTDLYRKLNRLIGNAYALQRMVTTHGDAQLSADSRLSNIDRELKKLRQRDLQIRSMVTSLSSIENAAMLVEESGVTDVERLALQSGLTEREANLMIQLRSAYSTDLSSPPAGEK